MRGSRDLHFEIELSQNSEYIDLFPIAFIRLRVLHYYLSNTSVRLSDVLQLRVCRNFVPLRFVYSLHDTVSCRDSFNLFIPDRVYIRAVIVRMNYNVVYRSRVCPCYVYLYTGVRLYFSASI